MREIYVAAVSLLVLGACAQFERGLEFTEAKIDSYCKNVPQIEREALRSRFVHPDGSPKAVVYCEPHAE